jgi:hypothetical protein
LQQSAVKKRKRFIGDNQYPVEKRKFNQAASLKEHNELPCIQTLLSDTYTVKSINYYSKSPYSDHHSNPCDTSIQSLLDLLLSTRDLNSDYAKKTLEESELLENDVEFLHRLRFRCHQSITILEEMNNNSQNLDSATDCNGLMALAEAVQMLK